MKATGIVRRIDDLGRIVIPKEIRRTMRIREGDPLEIYTDKNGEVIFKKYSLIGELSQFAGEYADVVMKSCNMPILISDRETIIACAGVPKKEVMGRRVSEALESIMELRQNYLYQEQADTVLYPIQDSEKIIARVASPIICEGDVAGCVIMLSVSDAPYATDTEKKVANVAANFLGKQIES